MTMVEAYRRRFGMDGSAWPYAGRPAMVPTAALATCNAPGCEGGCTRLHRTVRATVAQNDAAWYARGGTRD